MKLQPLFTLLLGLTATAALCAEEISFRVAGWNMEGNGQASVTLLEEQLAAKHGVDLWGLCEVRQDRFDEYKRGASTGEGSTFGIVEGNTGGGALRLAIIFDTSVLTKLSDFELDGSEAGGNTFRDVFENHREPLVAKFRGKRTDQDFFFMVNHMARGDANRRARQARFLNAWARAQTLPVIAVGDYNYDYHVEQGDFGQRDQGFDNMVANDAWEWLRPRVLVKTEDSDAFQTVLDFVFVANGDVMRDQGWMGVSSILNRSGDAAATQIDFGDNNSTTDHRPVDAVFTLRSDDHDDEIEEIIARMEEIEGELADLRVRLAGLLEEEPE